MRCFLKVLTTFYKEMSERDPACYERKLEV